MNETHPSLQRLLDRTLAFAHAALEEGTPRFIVAAMRSTEDLLCRIVGAKPSALPLVDAHRMIERVGHLRAVATLLERRLQLETRSSH